MIFFWLQVNSKIWVNGISLSVRKQENFFWHQVFLYPKRQIARWKLMPDLNCTEGFAPLYAIVRIAIYILLCFRDYNFFNWLKMWVCNSVSLWHDLPVCTCKHFHLERQQRIKEYLLSQITLVINNLKYNQTYQI